MSDSDSEPTEDAPPFVETDTAETQLPYDKGKVPIFVAIAWVAFLVTYVAVMASVALPDLRSWFAH